MIGPTVGYRTSVVTVRSGWRRIFFSRPESLGQSPLKLERQTDASKHEFMVENARWFVGKVIFATLHEVRAP